MLFHRRQDAQIALDTSRVVIANILLDHLDKLCVIPACTSLWWKARLVYADELDIAV